MQVTGLDFSREQLIVASSRQQVRSKSCFRNLKTKQGCCTFTGKPAKNQKQAEKNAPMILVISETLNPAARRVIEDVAETIATAMVTHETETTSPTSPKEKPASTKAKKKKGDQTARIPTWHRPNFCKQSGRSKCHLQTNVPGYSENSKAYIILNKHTMKVEESLNMTFNESPPPTKLSPLVDDDVGEEQAVENQVKFSQQLRK
ncbi:hypothetical protein Tco_0554430 [Tanacetum coccineum]